MTTTNRAGAVTALVLAIATLPKAALAVDGVTLVDQNKAMAGNVTPGDAPGFPVTLTQPGGYRLSSNLTVPSGAVAAIQINSDDVSIDLNGFAIRGPGVFGAEPFYGVNSTDRHQVKIQNGSITGFHVGLQFIGAAQFVTLERLFINADTFFPGFPQPVGGIAAIVGRDAAARALIREVQAAGQILVTCRSLVLDTIADGGVIEMNVPDNGSGLFFPVNCKGENVVF